VNANNSVVPFYGSYQSPEGRIYELRSSMDVYQVFSVLRKRMPGFGHSVSSRPTVVFSKRDPAKRFMVGANGELVAMGLRGVAL